jgi:hypothetical protein
VERNRKAGQNPPRIVAPTEEEEDVTEGPNEVVAEMSSVSILIQMAYHSRNGNLSYPTQFVKLGFQHH